MAGRCSLVFSYEGIDHPSRDDLLHETQAQLMLGLRHGAQAGTPVHWDPCALVSAESRGRVIDREPNRTLLVLYASLNVQWPLGT